MMVRLKVSYIVSIIVAAFLILSIDVVFLPHIRCNNAEKAVSAAFEEQPVSEKLLVSLFLDNIQEQCNLFYMPYYTIAPTVAYYFTTVKEIKETQTSVFITFTVLPYIGPHDTIGMDEITFSVDHAGEITMEKFKHLKNDTLPDNLKQIGKGTLPM